jgi:hypothetical protein
MSKIYFTFCLPWRPRKRFRHWKRQQIRPWNILRNMRMQKMRGTGVMAQLSRMDTPPSETPLDLKKLFNDLYAINKARGDEQ